MQKLALIVLTLSIGLSACGLPSKKTRADLTEEGIFRDLVSDPAFRDGNTDPRPVLEAVKRFTEELEELKRLTGTDRFIDTTTQLSVDVARSTSNLDASCTCKTTTSSEGGIFKTCSLKGRPFEEIYLKVGRGDVLSNEVYIVYSNSESQNIFKIVGFSQGRLYIDLIDKRRSLPDLLIPKVPGIKEQDDLLLRRLPARV